ncbi:hypothetical protein LEP1GSC027_3986 [Leptospira interrogans str. 2002000624]|nr:hypothetical protein LEP1GSC027_3986 [Leptospira interrogans str. 2002000624]
MAEVGTDGAGGTFPVFFFAVLRKTFFLAVFFFTGITFTPYAVLPSALFTS